MINCLLGLAIDAEPSIEVAAQKLGSYALFCYSNRRRIDCPN